MRGQCRYAIDGTTCFGILAHGSDAYRLATLRTIEARSAVAPVAGVSESVQESYYQDKKSDVHPHLNHGNSRFPIEATGADVTIADYRHYQIEYMIASSSMGIFYDVRAGNAEMEAIGGGVPRFEECGRHRRRRSCIATPSSYFDCSQHTGARLV